MKSIASVTVWYNPKNMTSPTASEAINTYASHMGKTYIVDNSDIDNSDLAAFIPNSVYIPNNKNLGIATALNQGCEAAMKDGFEWVMTMDQDSFFDETNIIDYLNKTESFITKDTSVKSYSVFQQDTDVQTFSITKQIRFKILSPLKRFILGKKYKPKEIQLIPVEYENRVIASANIINLSMWNQIGKFDDFLFIDEVDNNFCIRLKMNNYNIVRFNDCHVFHRIGNKKVTFFTKINYENDFRLFYIFRNLLIEKKRHGKFAAYRNYKKEIFSYFKDYCIFDFHAFKHFKIFVKAYREYKQFYSKGKKS